MGRRIGTCSQLKRLYEPVEPILVVLHYLPGDLQPVMIRIHIDGAERCTRLKMPHAPTLCLETGILWTRSANPGSRPLAGCYSTHDRPASSWNRPSLAADRDLEKLVGRRHDAHIGSPQAGFKILGVALCSGRPLNYVCGSYSRRATARSQFCRRSQPRVR